MKPNPNKANLRLSYNRNNDLSAHVMEKECELSLSGSQKDISSPSLKGNLSPRLSLRPSIGLDSQTYASISALLEIRHDTMDSGVSKNINNINRNKRKESVVGRMFKRTYSIARKRNSLISAMISSESENCLPSVAVFHPYSGPRMIWDLTIILMILYTAIGVPLRLSWSLPETVTVWIFDRMLDLVFMIDIAINFNTAFERGTELILERKQIMRHYLKTWFLLDFVASFPFDFFISLLNGGSFLSYNDTASNSSLSLLPRLVRLFKLSRLFRLARLQRILRRVQLQLGIRNSTNKILKFSGAAILCAHWMACMFYVTSTFGGSDSSLGDFPSWVDRLDKDFNQLDSSSVAHTYIASLYWSLTTMTSIGYGDVSPKTPGERVFGIFGMICGAVLFGHFMGNVLAVVADMSPAENEFHLKMDMLNVYMKEQNLTTELRRQIEEFYHIEHKLNNHQVDEAEILKELPDRLKNELSLAISRRILGNVPLFEGMSSSFIRTVGLSMHRRVYPQGEYVIREGLEVNKLYILTAGRACLLQGEQVIGHISNGEHFGSIPIHLQSITDTQSPFKSAYSVRTLEWTEVRSLSILIFRQLIGQFPVAKDVLIQRIADNLYEQSKKAVGMNAIKSSSGSMSPRKVMKEVVPCDEEVESGSINGVVPCDKEVESGGINGVVPCDKEVESGSINGVVPCDKEEVESVHDVDMESHPANAEMVSIRDAQNGNGKVSIDRQQLLNFVEHALSFDLRLKKKPQCQVKSQFVLEPEKDEASLLRQLREMDVNRTLDMSREQELRRQIGEELRDLDSLVTMLSLLVYNSEVMEERDDAEKQKELLRYMLSIADQRLLIKLTRLRKVVQYFLVSNPSDFVIKPEFKEDDVTENPDEVIASKVANNINSFFRSIVYLKSAQSIRQMFALQKTQSKSFTKRKRVLYRAENENESVVFMLFKLDYQTTFSNGKRENIERLGKRIRRTQFDVIMIDSDNIHEIRTTLQTVSAAKGKGTAQALFLVSNHLNFAELTELANMYGVQVILRKPMLFQDLQQLFKECGL